MSAAASSSSPSRSVAALGDEIAHDVARADPALGADRLEDVADLGIGARGPAHRLVDRREPGIDVHDEAGVPRSRKRLGSGSALTASEAGRSGNGIGSSSPTRATS